MACSICSVPQGTAGKIRVGMKICTNCNPGHWEYCDCVELDEDGWPLAFAQKVPAEKSEASTVPIFDGTSLKMQWSNSTSVFPDSIEFVNGGFRKVYR